MKKIAAILALVVLIAGFAGCGSEPPGSDEKSLPPKEFVAVGDWSAMVNGQSVVDSIMVNGSKVTEDGKVFAKVNLTFKNDSGDDRIFMLGMLNPSLVDAAGTVSPYELFVDGALDKVDTKMNETVTGDVFFKVTGDMTLKFEGMKLVLENLGVREQPKATIDLK